MKYSRTLINTQTQQFFYGILAFFYNYHPQKDNNWRWHNENNFICSIKKTFPMTWRSYLQCNKDNLKHYTQYGRNYTLALWEAWLYGVGWHRVSHGSWLWLGGWLVGKMVVVGQEALRRRGRKTKRRRRRCSMRVRRWVKVSEWVGTYEMPVWGGGVSVVMWYRDAAVRPIHYSFSKALLCSLEFRYLWEIYY